jgi:formamidopyrimidine-DNA glycosylase
MPELPEVETIRRDLSKLIVGGEILEVTTDTSKMIKPSLAKVRKAIIGTKIKQFKRRAKLLQVFLSSGGILVIHLKLTGRLLVRKRNDPKDDWQHVVISIKGRKSRVKGNNLELRFCDLRKFGWIKLVKNKKELKKILAEFGPEPLDDLNLKKFQAALSSTRRPVKVALLDQKKISGVGNIYANEALWLAEVSPEIPANKLQGGQVAKLLKSIEKVLRAGIKYRGASDQYYLDALGHKGKYQDHFLVYAREGKFCRRCKKMTIKKTKIAGRGTYFCPKCQKPKLT